MKLEKMLDELFEVWYERHGEGETTKDVALKAWQEALHHSAALMFETVVQAEMSVRAKFFLGSECDVAWEIRQKAEQQRDEIGASCLRRYRDRYRKEKT